VVIASIYVNPTQVIVINRAVRPNPDFSLDALHAVHHSSGILHVNRCWHALITSTCVTSQAKDKDADIASCG
jgi:hypothetical protein